MANLVQPVAPLEPIEERILEFKGLNRLAVVNEGEMSDMWNLCADNYPLLTQRKPRGVMRLPYTVERPIQLMAKFEKIAMIAATVSEVAFYYDDELIAEVDDLTEDSRMIAINTKICFFPQKTYIEVTQSGIVSGSYGSLEETYNTTTTLTPVTINISTDAATMVLEGKKDFNYDDAINLKGALTYGSTTENIDTSVIIESSSYNSSNQRTTITVMPEAFLNVTSAGASSATFEGTIKRSMPDLDHIVEWNNRLWGCSSEDNTIYASKLGDPKNWQYFQGTSLDAYYAQQGSDGKWTGIGVFSNHLIFFKEDSMCRVYGTSPSTFQISSAEVFGVEEGSSDSIVTINDTVFYKSKIGIMAYAGDVPMCISDKFNCTFKNVVAGTEKRKYYASIQTKGKGYELMVFDIDKAVWHKEDATHFRSCATIGDRLYFIQYRANLLKCSIDVKCSNWLIVGSEDVRAKVGIINPVNPEESADSMEWSAVFGPFDEYIEEHKIYSKLALRVIAKTETDDNYLVNEDYERILTDEDEEIEIERYFNVYISIDEGDWELVENSRSAKTKGDFIPIIPRRCDRYSIKLEGIGAYDIKSLTRRVRKGSFGRL